MQIAGPPAASVILGQIVAMGTTVWLLLMGAGIWALAAAPLVRAAIGLVIVVPYAARIIWNEPRLRPAFAKHACVDYFSLFRPVLVGMVGTMAAGKSDAIIIAMLTRPEVVVLYVVTRRVAELIGLVLARIGGAVFAPFAHLVGSGEHRRAYTVLGAITKLYWAAGVVLVVAYVALNEAFVSLWLGQEFFGGISLSVMIGIAILVVGYASLMSYLLGATGELARNGYYIFVESIVRVSLMLALFVTIGLVGLPAGAAVSSLLLAVAAYMAIRTKLHPEADYSQPIILWIATIVLLSVATGIALLGLQFDWVGLVMAAGLILAVASACMFAVLSHYDEFSQSGVLPIRRRLFARADHAGGESRDHT
jgi:O-antigen/teichoic acid export membrane protein